MRKKLILAAVTVIAFGSLAALGSSPGLIERLVAAMQVGGSESVQITDRASRKAAQMKNFGKDRPESKPTHQLTEKAFWYVVFNFTKDLQDKADRANQKGQAGSLFSDYFVRQGPLTPESDLALKSSAAKYWEEIRPLEEQVKKIMESKRAQSANGRSIQMQRPDQQTKDKLSEFVAQRDEITLRYRDSFKSAIGHDAFGKFVEFISTDFSKGSFSSSGSISTPEGFCPPDYFGFPTTFFNDDVEPPLITGSSFLVYFYDDCGPIYDPSLDSFFGDVTTSTLYDEGSDTGYQDIIPAEYEHPIFFSIRGHEFCTIEDEYLDLYDGPILIDEIFLEEDFDCHVVSPPPPPTPTPTPTPTPNVISVTFSQVTASSEPISQNPANLPYNPGVGLRIFPDHDTADDQVDRRLVRVTATLSQPIANVPVYFRNFDLVDPISDPAIYSVINPNPMNGDNNGTPHAGQLLQAGGCGTNGASTFCPTDANGVATIVFRVTQQPGDNFAIAAGLDPAGVNAVNVSGIELTNSGGQNLATESCPTQALCRSQMLTVWRKLHIEVDSMGTSTGNYVLGTIPTGFKISPNQTMVVTVSPSPNDPLETNRFEGGRLALGIRSLRVISNTTTTVTVRNGTSAAISIANNSQFQLYDDDDLNDSSPTALNGDTSEDIPDPNDSSVNGTALLTAGSDDPNTNVFATAYIQPVYDIANPRNDCIFMANSLSDAAADLRPEFTPCWDSSNTNANSMYWSVLIFGAYQHVLGEDNDPSNEACPDPQFLHCVTYGIVDEITGLTGDLEGSGALIFTELHRPHETPGYTSSPANLDSMAVTVAHETSHLFSCRHGDGGIMGVDGGGQPVSNQYSPTMIRKIRGLMHP